MTVDHETVSTGPDDHAAPEAWHALAAGYAEHVPNIDMIGRCFDEVAQVRTRTALNERIDEGANRATGVALLKAPVNIGWCRKADRR